jgi:putative ABC transport system permease protein
MRFATLVLTNIFRRPMRSALTVSGVAIAVTVVVALVGVARSFEKTLLAIYQSRGVDLIVTRAGGVQRLGSVLDEKLTDQVRQLPGVTKVSPALAEVVSFEKLDIFGVVVRGLPLDSFVLDDIRIVAGRRLQSGDKRAVMLGAIIAKNLDTGVGRTLEVVAGTSCEVIGIFESHNLFENGSMIMPLDELQQLMDRKGEVTMLTVITEQKTKEALDSLREQIASLAPQIEVLPAREYIETAIEVRLARAVAWLTSTIALMVGTIGMINTMLTAVFERTRELAILRAIGWRKGRVMKLILWESIVLGLAGAVTGTLLAIVITQVLSRLPAAGRLVSGEISSGVVLQGFLIATLVGLIGGLFPAFRAARLVPTEGLRHE